MWSDNPSGKGSFVGRLFVALASRDHSEMKLEHPEVSCLRVGQIGLRTALIVAFCPDHIRLG